MFSPNISPDVYQSRVNALKVSDYYLTQGDDVFMFESRDTGRAFVITREMGLEAYLISGSRLLSFTSPDLYKRGNTIWHEAGHG